MVWSLEITWFSWKFDFTLQRQSLSSGTCSEHMIQGGHTRSCVELLSHSWCDSNFISNNTKQVCKLKTTSNLKLKQLDNTEAVNFVNRSDLNFRVIRTIGLQMQSGVKFLKSAITYSGSSSRSVQTQNLF
jgi:hypothetical protein